jgi:hypothetical protein
MNRKSMLILVLAFCFSTGIVMTLNASADGDVQVMPPATLENIAKGKTYTLSVEPNYPRTTDARDTTVDLTDGEYAEQPLLWIDKLTVGWKGKKDKMAVTITIDMGSAESICGISFSTAAQTSSGVFWPSSINILTSDDGKTFRESGDLIRLSAINGVPPDPKEKYVKYRFWTDKINNKARYIQLQIKATGEYIFVDEIEVYRSLFSS